MNRKPTVLRRLVAVVGAAFVGLVGAVALGNSPAFAHHSAIEGKAVCDTATGEYVVDWTIRTFAPEDADHFKFVYVNAYRAINEKDIEYIEVPGISVTPEDQGYPYATDEPFKVTQRVDGKYVRVALAVRSKWSNGFEEKDVVWNKVYFPGTCEKGKAEPHATAEYDCDAAYIQLTNDRDAKVDAEFTITNGDWEKKVTVKPGEELEPIKVPAVKGDKITVTEKTTGYVYSFTHKPKSGCGEPTGAIKATCDDITFALDNPEDGPESIELTFTPSVGEPVTRTVAAGSSMEPVTFPASEGLTITISSPGEEDEVVKYADYAPEDCDAPSTPPPGGGGGGEEPPLPVTGANTGLIAGGAGVLLALGAGLFLVARRRRVRFSS